MILTKGTKEVLINDVSAAFPFVFTKPDAANPNKEVAATAADATHLAIKGYGDIFLSGLSGSISAQRARPEIAGVITVDSAVAAQLTIAANNAATTVVVRLRQRSSDPLPEYVTGDPGRYFRTREYAFAVPAAVTAAQFLALLNTQINTTAVLFPEADEPLELQISSSITGTVLRVSCSDSHVILELGIADLDAASRALVPVLKPIVAVANDEGRNIYRELKGGRLQTEGTNGLYAVPGPLELAEPGARYSSVSFATITARPDLSNHGAADSPVSTGNKFLVYIRETAGNEARIQDLINFLSRADAGVSKTYSTQFADNTTKAQFVTNTVL